MSNSFDLSNDLGFINHEFAVTIVIMNNKHSSVNLTNQFLMSMPHLSDDHFTQTLIYVCDHTEQGAMGIVINRPLDMSLKEILNHLEIDCSRLGERREPVFDGGPVSTERGFIIHSPTEEEWSSSYAVTDEVSLSTSLDILESIAAGEGPERFVVALGYAGWSAGQLEEELAANHWLSCPADLDILFNTQADERLKQAAGLLGVDLSLLTSQAGHS